jgi:hypothetical protein
LKADQSAKSVLTNHRPSYIVILVMLRALALSINSKLWAAFMVNSLLNVTQLWTWFILKDERSAPKRQFSRALR